MIGLGARTLLNKEVRRFLRVPGQTVFSPLLNTIIYLGVFGYALGGRLRSVGGVGYLDFIVPGLIMLGAIGNAFANTSSSMIVMKLQGTITDILVAPLTNLEIAGAMVGAAAVRGMMVAVLSWFAALLLGGSATIAHPLWALLVLVLTTILFGALGLFSGIWADKVEHLNFVPVFVITPLTFFGGVFYDVNLLPEPWRTLSLANPILYLVEGMRYGITGHTVVEPWVGLSALVAAAFVAVAACTAVLRSGWKLRG